MILRTALLVSLAGSVAACGQSDGEDQRTSMGDATDSMTAGSPAAESAAAHDMTAMDHDAALGPDSSQAMAGMDHSATVSEAEGVGHTGAAHAASAGRTGAAPTPDVGHTGAAAHDPAASAGAARARAPAAAAGGHAGHASAPAAGRGSTASPPPPTADDDAHAAHAIGSDRAVGDERLRMLVSQLLRDTAVLARIRADTALYRLWQNEAVRRALLPRQ